MIVICPRLWRISIGKIAAIIAGMPSGRQVVALLASGVPFASASRAACTRACHSWRYAGLSGGGGAGGGSVGSSRRTSARWLRMPP